MKRVFTALALTSILSVVAVAASRSDRWTNAEIEQLRSLSLAGLPPLPPDPTNTYGDDPRAAEFGTRLFFDTRLSSSGRVSCGTCHQPAREFQDGTSLAAGVGTTNRR